jgi:hypothetical protein
MNLDAMPHGAAGDYSSSEAKGLRIPYRVNVVDEKYQVV